MQQAWTYSKGMQEQSTGTIPKGENNITLEDMEEEGSTVRKMWHNVTYSDTTQHRHNRLRGS